MKKALIYILVFGILCVFLGVVAGVAYEKRYIKNHFPQVLRSIAQKQTARDWRENRIKQMVRKLDQELGLSDDQKNAIEAILEETAAEVKTEWQKFSAASSQLRDEAINRISQELKPEQNEKFQKLNATFAKKRSLKRR